MPAMLTEFPLVFAFPVFLLGLIGGSFANAVMYRVPSGESLNTRSHCTTCEHVIPWYENIPLFSYVILGGKCSSCRSPISIRYPAVELFSGVLAVGIAYIVGMQVPVSGLLSFNVLAFGYVALLSALVALFAIDVKHHKLPRQIIYWGGAILLVAQVAATALSGWEMLPELKTALISMAALFAFYFVLWFIYPKGMGFGDVRLAALLGLAGGFLSASTVVVGGFAAFFFAGIYGVSVMIVRGSGRKTRIPFGPWMMVGMLFGVLAGDVLMDAYLGLVM